MEFNECHKMDKISIYLSQSTGRNAKGYQTNMIIFVNLLLAMATFDGAVSSKDLGQYNINGAINAKHCLAINKDRPKT